MEAVQIFDYALFALFVGGLLYLLHKRKKDVKLQKIASIGKVPIIYMAMLRTTWGIKLMERMAKKYGKFVRYYGYFSIGVATVGMVVGLVMMGFVVVKLFTDPVQAQIAPALPFTSIPFLGYLSFTHWIIIIGFIATVHEFAHGVVSKAFGVQVKKSGIAVFGLLLPVIPAAFVEPDEKKLRKNEAAFYSTIAAGPTINILTAVIFWLVLAFILVPVQQDITYPAGFSLDPTNTTGPSYLAGFNRELIITHIDGVDVNSSALLIETLQTYEYPESLTFSGYNDSNKEDFSISFIPAQRTDGIAQGYIGAQVYDEFRYYDVWYKDIFGWFLRLFQLLFLFSVGVAIVNMLPLAITDGGQIFAYLFDNGKGSFGRKFTVFISLLMLAILLAGIAAWGYFTFGA